MSTIPVVPAEHADWIAKRVLTGTFLNSCGGLELVRLCACQYGPCGHCGSGNHGKCTTRVGFAGKPPAQPLAYVLGRKGGVVASVAATGKPCRWACPCTDCPTEQQRPSAVAYRTARGDLRRGDTVWLTPRTPGCPSICWSQPRGTVVATAGHGAYVVVKVGRREHRVHTDNVRRSDPAASHGVVEVRPRQRLALPDGFEEIPLF